MQDQTSHFSRRLRGLPPKLEGLTHSCRNRSLSLTRTSSRPSTTRSESPRASNVDQLQEGNFPPSDDFDPPIVEYYHSEDESPRSDSETETLVDEIKDSLNILSLRNPRVRNIIGSSMSGELNTPPLRGTNATRGNIGNLSSTSGTGSRTISGSTSATFHTPPGGPFSYGMPPPSGISNAYGGSNSFFFHNTVGAIFSNPFNNLPHGSNVSFNAPLFGSGHPTSGAGPSGNMFTGAFPPYFGSFVGNVSSHFHPLGHSAFGSGFQSASNTNSGPTFWNTGGNVGG